MIDVSLKRRLRQCGVQYADRWNRNLGIFGQLRWSLCQSFFLVQNLPMSTGSVGDLRSLSLEAPDQDGGCRPWQPRSGLNVVACNLQQQGGNAARNTASSLGFEHNTWLQLFFNLWFAVLIGRQHRITEGWVAKWRKFMSQPQCTRNGSTKRKGLRKAPLQPGPFLPLETNKKLWWNLTDQKKNNPKTNASTILFQY